MALGFETNVPNVVFYLKAGSLVKVRKMLDDARDEKVILEPDYSIELQSGWLGTQYGGCYLKFIKAENKAYNARRTLITFSDEPLSDTVRDKFFESVLTGRQSIDDASDDEHMRDVINDEDTSTYITTGEGENGVDGDLQITEMTGDNNAGVTMHRLPRRYKHTPASLPKLLTFYYAKLEISEEYWGNWWNKINLEDVERSLLIFGVPTKYEDKIAKLQNQLYKKLGIMPSNLQPLPSPSVNLSIWLFETENAEDVNPLDCQPCFIEGPYSRNVQYQIVLHKVPHVKAIKRKGHPNDAGGREETAEPASKRRRVRYRRKQTIEPTHSDGADDYVPPKAKQYTAEADVSLLEIPASTTVAKQQDANKLERSLAKSLNNPSRGSNRTKSLQHETITVVYKESKCVLRQFPDCLAANILDQLARYKLIQGIKDFSKCYLVDNAGSIIMDTTPIDSLAFPGEAVLRLRISD